MDGRRDIDIIINSEGHAHNKTWYSILYGQPTLRLRLRDILCHQITLGKNVSKKHK